MHARTSGEPFCLGAVKLNLLESTYSACCSVVTDQYRGRSSGVTEQCGALSQSSGSGPLFFAHHVYKLRLPLTA